MASPSKSPPQSEPEPVPLHPISTQHHQTLPVENLDQNQSDEQNNQDTDHNIRNPSLSPPPSMPRRQNKRKKGALHKKKQQKVESLIKTLNPIPFFSPKSLDLDRHEELLKSLGLWEFVHIEFDRNIRIDLITQLIINYDPKLRCSYVNGFRINVNRPTLGRALKLPVRKEKGGSGAQEAVVLDLEEYDEEISRFVDDFLLNWVLLHGEMWEMPSEVMSWMREIKGRNPEKADWTGLIWIMVEKELSQGVKLEDCYYASHLQYLIRSQREEVFEEDETEVGEEEGAGLNKTVEVDEESVCVEEPNVELTLGPENIEKEEVNDGDAMDVKESKEDDMAQGDWILDGKNLTSGQFLQRCNVEEYMGMGSDEETKYEEEGERAFIGGEEDEMTIEEEGEGEGEEEGDEEFSLTPKNHHFGGDVFPVNLHQGIDTNHISYGVSEQFDYQSNMCMISSDGPSSFFPSGMKRDISHSDDILQDHLNGGNKRLRIDGSSGKSSDFDFCLDQIQLWVGKAMAMYEAKEKEAEDLSKNQQILIRDIQQRENVIEHLQKTKYEELQNKDKEINQLDRELFVMGNLINGYRDAVKATQKDFNEYRKRCQLPEEPIYKDVGPGGLVLSKMEIERLRLKREEENRVDRAIVEHNVKQFEEGFMVILEGYLNRVTMMDTKLLGLEKEVIQIKEVSDKGKVSEMVDSAAANE